MCEPVSATMFGVSALTQIAGYQKQKRTVKEANRARLKNWHLANDQYLSNVITEDALWKNTVTDTNIAIDQAFTAAANSWVQQDLELESIAREHAWNKNEVIREMYQKEYAGEGTGVTAARLAGEDVRQAGFAISKSLGDLVMNRDKVYINKEIARIDANQKRKKYWADSWRSPVHGHTPRAPEMQREPGIGGLLLGLAFSGALAYAGGTMAKGSFDKSTFTSSLEGGSGAFTAGSSNVGAATSAWQAAPSGAYTSQFGTYGGNLGIGANQASLFAPSAAPAFTGWTAGTGSSLFATAPTFGETIRVGMSQWPTQFLAFQNLNSINNLN